MTTFEFDGEFDRRVYADWHLPVLSRLFGDRIELRHELYRLTHTHRRQHNGGSDVGSCVAWPSPPARAPIWRLIVDLTGAKRFLEIGTALGYATALMADAAGPGGHVDTIEIDQSHADEAATQLNKLGLESRVRILCGDASTILPTLSETYDVVFADGGSGEISRHISRLTRPGGAPAEAIASLRDPLIDVLESAKRALGESDDSDDSVLAKTRRAYRQIVSQAVVASHA